MGRTGAVTFKGTPLTLAGKALSAGDAAPDFTLHYYEGGLKELKLADLKGKPTLLSVVPSLDTPVCAMQTKKFNDALASRGGKINAVTVSLDLPFAQGRFCTSEGISNMRAASDYQDRNFGNSYGTLIEELKILSRAIFVLDGAGKIAYVEYVPEVASEPAYDPALAAVKSLL